MDEQNKELLDKVIKDRLEHALGNTTETEEDKQAFKEAMDALSKRIELEKIETSHREQNKKMEIEKNKDLRNEKIKISEANKDRIIQIGTFTAGLFLGPIIESLVKKGYAKMLCEFEKDYTFTTSAGRALSGLFRFKK